MYNICGAVETLLKKNISRKGSWWIRSRQNMRSICGRIAADEGVWN
jgi:hypothetical protein